MGMQTNLYCTSESCYIAFAQWCYFSRLYSTNIHTEKITQHIHPPSPKGKVQAKLNHKHTHKLHNTHCTHKMCHSHTHTHTHTHTHKHTHTHVHSQTVNKLSHSHTHTHKMSVIHTHAHSKTVNCLIHTHTNGLSFTHSDTHFLSHTHTHVYDPYLTVQYMYVQIGRITGIALCCLIMLCIPWTSSKQKHKLWNGSLWTWTNWSMTRLFLPP